MSEFITIQVGQCGNQIGDAFWPLVLQEHGIDTQRESTFKSQPQHIQPNERLLDAFHSFFSSSDGISGHSFKTLADLEKAKVTARAVCIDMEDSVVARFRTGQFRHLFDDTCLLTNYPGSGNNWAEGFHTHGREYNEKILNLLQRSAERCDQLHGFLCLFSLGGGTGSGLGSAILSILEDNFPLVERFVTCVYPAGNEDVVTSPYNVVLATRELTHHASCVFPVDNKALLDICSRLKSSGNKHGVAGYIAACKPFQDMNSIVVNMLLHLTSGSRFPGSMNVDMNEIYNNMVPFPCLRYISSSVSPLLFPTSGSNTAPGMSLKPDDLFTSAWSRGNQLLKVDPLGGTVLGATLLARGSVFVSDMRRNIDRFQKKTQFIPWSCSDAMKTGLCSVPPPGLTSSVLSLINTSNMSSLFKDVAQKFNKLYQRKAHVHHYLQVPGFDEEDFTNSLESLHEVEEGYAQLTNLKAQTIPRLQVL
ncbi:Tubulin epsilon chain [Cryptotermes secundus]|uniref:Tubulin epsilon chain n=2 Tax=Cryptotermes secundus TaxID=105785 RepID=A0A2J7QF47_9NEOP|nr:tubulin epsilon chain isoform X1 [Cryptotermes secundus]PNF27212.1 Tubulin epsilon chain [Cryptotermes secundus]PNF27213.1 Tubulin epsilon chain [Cryptotermes secundus]